MTPVKGAHMSGFEDQEFSSANYQSALQSIENDANNGEFEA